MRQVFTEATLRKMEAFWTRHRWETEPPPFLYAWCNPSFLLRPDEEYTRKLYLRTALTQALGTVLWVTILLCAVIALSALFWPGSWQIVHDPKNHAFLIGDLSREGFYYLPWYPLMLFLFSLTMHWPGYFFWNRRARRLRREDHVQAPITAVIAEATVDDGSSWPPAPRRVV
jgi:hypothetical protein